MPDTLAKSLRTLADMIDQGVIPVDRVEKLTVHVDATLDVSQTLAARDVIGGGMSQPDKAHFGKRAGSVSLVRTFGHVGAVRVVLQVPAENLGEPVSVRRMEHRIDPRIVGVLA